MAFERDTDTHKDGVLNPPPRTGILGKDTEKRHMSDPSICRIGLCCRDQASGVPGRSEWERLAISADGVDHSRMTTAPPRVPRYRGALAVVRSSDMAYVRLAPTAGWAPPSPRIHDWRGQRHLAERAAIPAEVRAKLALRLPEDTCDPAHTRDLAMLTATSLVVVADPLRDALLACGVRVWTVGYHRNPAMLRIAAAGGADAPVCVEQCLYGLYAGDGARPCGRPERVPWNGMTGDFDGIDRILRTVSRGVLDEDSVLLADEIVRCGWDAHLQPLERRRKDLAFVRSIDTDPDLAEEACYAHLRWQFERPQRTELPESDEAHAREMAAALLRPDGSAAIEVERIGEFWREGLHPEELRLAPDDLRGWLPAVSGLPEP